MTFISVDIRGGPDDVQFHMQNGMLITSQTAMPLLIFLSKFSFLTATGISLQCHSWTIVTIDCKNNLVPDHCSLVDRNSTINF